MIERGGWERERPVTEEILEPGLAWMVMATEAGGTERIQPGNFGLLGISFEFD